MLIVILALAAVAWVGHACVCTAALNVLYGLPLPKLLLKGWRFATGAVILAFPLVALGLPDPSTGAFPSDGVGVALLAYVGVCLAFGGIIFPVITLRRATRKPPGCLAREEVRTIDLWGERGAALTGDGRHRWAVRVPGNCAFKLDFTDLTLRLPNLPPALDGLTILLLSDLHFHGTPARDYFERLIDEVLAGPTPDLICLAGDFVDSDTHHEWIRPLLGRLRATEGKFAVLGNHDKYHDPERVRAELAAAGYAVLGNGWQAARVRGVECVLIGHEGPWFRPGPDLTAAPPPGAAFRLCVSHTPDNFYWGVRNGIGLMLSGHVHGGGIRVPLVGSIFVPSVYGRRFDCGVFEDGGTAMVVSRGVSGKEPLRIRCNPQAIRITLVPSTPTA
jgi:uncharacterized protein